jgi:hypothetical protein
MVWIHLAQDIEQWQAVVGMVMNILVPKNVGSFLNG